MNTENTNRHYLAFYNGKQTVISAPSLFDAHTKAVAAFKPPRSKQHMVHVYLAEKELK